tara:strand:- start:46 stop:1032 length:987 start_codon:yes stop_codon:yes gene_type:complete
MVEPILEVNNLHVEFRTHEGIVKAVNGLSYKVMPGQTLGIVGESGSGKSVSSMAVMDLLPKPPAVIKPGSSIKIMGKEVTGLSPQELRHYRGNVMSMIFQDPMTCLNPYRRIDKQMIEAQIYHKGATKLEALKKAQEMLEYVHIPDAGTRLKSYPHELSGGMRQRVMIAMALTCDPKLIFADEPTTALDVTVQAQIMKLFKEIQEKFNTAIVLISHDLGVISTQCDEIVVMYAGQVMERGTPKDIFENPKHPYTLALKRSIPELYPEENEEKNLYTIPGLPPNLMKLGEGCPFAPRCESVKDHCKIESIDSFGINEGHEARCLLLKEQ